MTPTPEQATIIALARDPRSLLINALAGAAKTTTLCLLAAKLPLVPTACVAFNKRIADEMSTRMPGHIQCSTLNSLGHRVWGKKLSRRLVVNTDKSYKILSDLVAKGRPEERARWGDMFASILRATRMAKSAGYVPDSLTKLGKCLTSQSELIELFAPQIDVDPSSDFLSLLDKSLETSVTQSFDGVIDFDDQIYMSCQPAGTMVQTRFGKKAIEEIKVGDQVISFDRKLSRFVGMYNHASEILETGSREYTGLMYRILAGDKSTIATAEHKWLVRFRPEMKRQTLFFTYMMEREGSFRIGQTQVKSIRPSGIECFGFSARCTQEKAERGWILGSHNTLQEAKAQEAILVALFGITDTCFESDIGYAVHLQQKLWTDLKQRAENCLLFFRRRIEFPFWKPQATRSFESNMVVESCNLLDWLMQVPLWQNGPEPNWQSVYTETEPVTSLPVFSLTVARHELYVADEILTHNSLFGASSYPKFDQVLVDEAQDLSPLNHETLRLMFGGRLIAVGDPFQCQPAGTMVMTEKGEVPIESLLAGDEVISLHRDKTCLRNKTVIAVASRFYVGELIKVQTQQNSYEATPNHRCLVRVSQKKQHWSCVYLMRRGNNFRVGKTVLRRVNEKNFGPALRARQEKADALWLLESFACKEDALANEELLAVMYALPTFCFINSGELAISQKRLDWMWSQIGDNTKQAKKLLTAYGRYLEFPLWEKNQANQLSTERNCLVRSCNLEDSLFDVPVVTGDNVIWEPAYITRRNYSGVVHSLEVDTLETTNNMGLYVSNGIVTGNSIYAFRGAHHGSMSALRDEFNMIEAPLSISFRCPRAIVRNVHWRVPAFLAADWAEEGKVEDLSTWSCDTIPDGAAIICRNNAPLFRIAMRLIRKGRGIKLIGADIGKSLTTILKKLGPGTLTREQVLAAIGEWEEGQTKKAHKARLASIRDRAECLRVFAEFGATLDEAVAYAQTLFASSGPIQLLTGHKSKGMEYDTVFHLDPELIPSKWALRAAEEGESGQLEQEYNLRYVISTRAKKELFLIRTEDMV